MADFISDDEMDKMAPTQTAPASSGFISDDEMAKMGGADPEETQEKYGTTGQQIGAGLEGIAQGVAGPLATGAELGLSKLGVPGLSAEDIKGRAEANPITHGIGEATGLVGGMFTGTGEAALLGKAAEAIPLISKLGEAGTLGKIGASAIKGAVEAGLFQGGDEISKAMLGQADPEAPVASALAHMGTAALFGSATGGLFGTAGVGLSKIGETKMGAKMAQWGEDFGNRIKYLKETPDPVDAVTNELHDFHASTNEAADEVYGAKGLKSQAIQKLTSDIDPDDVAKHVSKVRDLLDNVPAKMQDDPLFQEAVDKWKQATTSTRDPMTLKPISTPEASDVFQATDALKRQMQEWGQFNKAMVPLADVPFRNMAKNTAFALKDSLEDSGIWGKAADLQKGTNKAFSDFLPALKDFNSKFTTKIEGDPTIDPGKIATYMKQLGKPNAEIKQTMMKNYVDAAEKYRDRITDLHSSLGLESPLVPASLNSVKETLGEQTMGRKFADYLVNHGPSRIGETVGEGGGALLAGAPGFFAGKALAPYLSDAVGRPITNMAGNALIKVLGTGAYKGTAEALSHASNVDRGAQKIASSMGKLFTVGTQKVYDGEINAKDREKIKSFIEKGGLPQQIQNQLFEERKNATPTPTPGPQGFADGGAVSRPHNPDPDVKNDTGGLSAVYPDQDQMLQTAKGRIYNYLNSLRPQENQPKLAYDKAPDNKMVQKKYDRAVDIAASPLSVLNDVKTGSLTPDDLTHFGNMFPELHSHLQKEMTKKITDHQVEDERPNYKTRQGLSMFLGTPVDSSMHPANVIAAQMVFANQKQQIAQAPTKTKKGTSKLGEISKDFQTANQSASERQVQER